MYIDSGRHTVLPLSPGGVKIQRVDNGFIVTVSDGVNEESERVLVFESFYAMMEGIAEYFDATLELRGELVVEHEPEDATVNIRDRLDAIRRPVKYTEEWASPLGVDWDEVDHKHPEAATMRFAAQDRNGGVYVYRNRPTTMGYQWVAANGGPFFLLRQDGTYTENWRQTLVERDCTDYAMGGFVEKPIC